MTSNDIVNIRMKKVGTEMKLLCKIGLHLYYDSTNIVYLKLCHYCGKEKWSKKYT